MPKQTGLFQIEGTLGDYTFYKSKDGPLVRRKGGVSASKIANDPAFERTRENGAEFGKAGKAGKLLRSSIRGLAMHATDGKMVSRLASKLLKVIQSDETHDRGARVISAGDLTLMKGFDFNIKSVLSTTLLTPYTVTTDKAAGTATISLPEFIPSRMLAAPTGSTHFRIISCVSCIDFDAEVFETASNETAETVIGKTNVPTITLSHSFTANTTRPVLVMLGLEYLQEMNGSMYPLLNGGFNSFSIVHVTV